VVGQRRIQPPFLSHHWEGKDDAIGAMQLGQVGLRLAVRFFRRRLFQRKRMYGVTIIRQQLCQLYLAHITADKPNILFVMQAPFLRFPFSSYSAEGKA
jgi:hypothetical protein